MHTLGTLRRYYTGLATLLALMLVATTAARAGQGNGNGKTKTPPSISISVPGPSNIVIVPPNTATIQVNANVTVNPGMKVTNVKFFVNSLMAGGAVSKSPYSMTLNNLGVGTYVLTAVAGDNGGGSTKSNAVTITVAADPSSTSPGSEPLLHTCCGAGNDVSYLGAFRVPFGPFGSEIVSGNNVDTFAYGGTSIAFNAAHNSLFMVGHDYGQRVAEISIPAVTPGSDISQLATASILQSFADPTDGLLANVSIPNCTTTGCIKIGGLFPQLDSLYISAYNYYTGDTQITSDFASSANLSAPNAAQGPYQVGTTGFCGLTNCAGFVSGYFGAVPSEWQPAVGKVLTGNCCLNVISRTSYGPALFGIDPTQFGTQDPLPALPLVYYPSTHPMQAWDSSWSPFFVNGTDASGGIHPNFNGTTEVRGVVMVKGTRSVLFFGRQGTGTFCYGFGVSDPNSPLLGTPINPADPSAGTYCYDPAADPNAKGVHGYPYVYYIWAYDANDLAAVAANQKNPWDVKPYAEWPLGNTTTGVSALPFTQPDAQFSGAAYDPVAKRIYVSAYKADDPLPIVYVFSTP